MKNYSSDIVEVPQYVKVRAVLAAQEAALEEINGMGKTAARVELFWLVYNFEFRKQIERWIGGNAPKKGVK